MKVMGLGNGAKPAEIDTGIASQYIRKQPHRQPACTLTDCQGNIMSAIFDFTSLLTVLLLLICTCTYLREMRPGIFDPMVSVLHPVQLADFCGFSINYYSHLSLSLSLPLTQPSADGSPFKREGISGFFWKLSRIGERLSPYVGAGCAIMAIHVLFFK